MKKLIVLILCFSMLSCDDGDLDIPAFEFEEEVFGCDIRNSNYTLFRLGISEAIIVAPSDFKAFTKSTIFVEIVR